MYDRDDREVLNSGIPMLRAERHAVDHHGREFWTEATKLPLSYYQGGQKQKGLLCHYRDITLERARRKQLETLASIMTTDSAHRVLDRLVAGTAELAQVDIAFVGRFNPDDGTITVIASHSSGDSLDGVTYRLQDTPCESVFEENLCVYTTNVQQRFPKDFMLGELGITSYAGRRLLDNHGSVVGLFALMNNDAIPNLAQATSLVDIVSSTAAYELIRETRENALIESEKRYRNIFDSVPVMICTTDKDHNIHDINSTWIETTGYIHSDIVGKSVGSLFSDIDRCAIEDSITKAWLGEEHEKEGYLSMMGANGEKIIVNHSAVYTTSAGSDGVTINVFEDMREWYQSAQQLRLAATAFETHEALLIRDEEMNVLRVNAAFAEVTGFTQSEIIHSDFKYFVADDEQDIWQIARTDGKWNGNGKCRRRHGDSFNAYQTITAVKDDTGRVTHFVENFNDITDYVEALAETERLAYFDSLTELPNRRQLSERLAESLASAKQHKVFGAVMFIDLDHFKNINDAVGHSVGDLVLQQVSKRLLRILREEDTISRLGGDEFVVLVPSISSDKTEAQTQATLIAEKIQRDLRSLYYLDDHEFHITPTIGVTLFPEKQDSVDDVLKQADTAMYRAKAEGRNQTKFYHESMLDSARERLSIEKDLRTAVHRGELHLVFQPQVRADGKVFGAEALLRWQHPTRGLVSPVVFIPIAEETGLIIEIGRWVLEEAFRVLAHWDNIFPAKVIEHLSVNVSSRQFSAHDFVEDVARRLKENGTDPKKVVLEVTESTVIDKIQATVSKMEQLKGLGVRFSVDDFGTGYSSLAYLSRLPLDQLKIDRTFVANIHDDPANAVIVETIISMGRHLGLQTVAEGVETAEQLKFLDERRCNAYQGYYFAKPLAADEFERYLLEQQP
jgi:diguanylate cyclase (GGDEF)-like protein/PAS domain S-box-containing protein